MLPNSGIVRTMEYQMIDQFYGNRTANRSGVPLMNHIVEGLTIMQERGASISGQRAFCLHPIVQRDEDLAANIELVTGNADRYSILLAMEYRNIANQYLSHRHVSTINEIALSPLAEVNEMLVADKIQNYKDFLLYHKGTHPRSAALNYYFSMWLTRLGIDSDAFEAMLEKLA